MCASDFLSLILLVKLEVSKPKLVKIIMISVVTFVQPGCHNKSHNSWSTTVLLFYVQKGQHSVNLILDSWWMEYILFDVGNVDIRNKVCKKCHKF